MHIKYFCSAAHSPEPRPRSQRGHITDQERHFMACDYLGTLLRIKNFIKKELGPKKPSLGFGAAMEKNLDGAS